MPIPAFIREQPAALDRCIAAARAFARTWSPAAADGIALVGSGSSFNALRVAQPAFVAARRGPVVVHEPQDFAVELPQASARALVIVLSQSGASTTSIAAAQAAVAAGLPTLAITASSEAPLGRTGAEILVMPVGDEPVGPKTKGFLGSLVLLQLLAEALGAPASTPPDGAMLQALVEPAREAAEALVPTLADVDQIVVAGRRSNHGLALEASLKIAEMAGIPTAAFPTEELLHGRLHGLTPRSVAFVIAEGKDEQEEARRAAAAMAARGCRLIVAGSGHWPAASALPAPWQALGMVLPFQWLAVRLAEARGLRPEAMRYGSLSPELAIKTDQRP
ncbi:SIS domain-containing protein [Vineibacter terrae]|uniref:SIS domain-containing protein n=1 Tax=Vineibacter terrae TaxID=2586908 RepID=UPI002E37F21E|nr:SIS domain-containing protein [Vineibacter terrae]HEX2885436.1 SIS domain-containing protein [Vineibacter terrae]